MSEENNETFFNRADEHIGLSNKQITDTVDGDEVSASMMYAAARFNAWLSATSFTTAEELAKAKKEQIKYYMDEYRSMLQENFDDYIENFQYYMSPDNNK